ncbi:MAG: hypothetical protein J6R77_05485 [Clostridia bacterium]|nr:hypothetical protein [Clostridia bacterium]
MKKLCALLSLLLVVAILAGLVGEVAPALSIKAEDPAYYVLDDCDTTQRFAWQLDPDEKQQGRYSLRTSANGTAVELKNSSSIRQAVPENFGNWYVELWLYIDNLNRLTLRDCTLELAKNNNIYLRWRFNNMGLVKGWNRVQVKVSNASEKVGFDKLDEINLVKLNLKTSGSVMLRLDDICIVKESVASDRSGLTAAIAQAGEVTENTLSSVAESLKVNFEKAKETALKVEADTTASQRDVDAATMALVDAMNAFGFDGFAEDMEALYSYVDFAALTYSFMDNFKVEGGERTNHSGRKTTAFTNQLLINPGAKYVGDAADIRFTFTYFDGDEGGIELYVGTAEGVKKVLTVECAGSGAWKIASVRVRDTALARSVDGYDVSLKAIGGKTAYVSRFETKLITAADLAEADPPEYQPETDVNNILGASVFGYQMWFTATASQAGWGHWGGGEYGNPAPGNGNLSFDIYPHVQDYLDNGATLYKTNLGELGDGTDSMLFSSKDLAIADTHFQWLKEYELDCMAIQRFGCGFQRQLTEEENHLVMVRDLAEKYDKTFYVMYDVSGQGTKTYDELYDAITTDWVYNVERAGVSTSTHYAHAEGKPVVCIWGITGNRNDTNYPCGATASRVIRWFQDRGYFVIIGTPDNSYASRKGDMLEPFAMADMISPWTVGRYDYNSVPSWLPHNLSIDTAFCEKYGIEYQPVIFPGFSWVNMQNNGKPNAYPRMAGEFIWRQAKMIADAGVTNMYFAMFDEYDEATAWMKGGSDYFDIPKSQYFVTYATDGQWLSNDYYLRTAQKVAKLIRGETEDTTLNIPYSQGPVYWRNSFEKRWTTFMENEDRQTVKFSALRNIDVCAPVSTPLNNKGMTIDRKADQSNPEYKFQEEDTVQATYSTSRENTGIFRDVSGAYTKSGEWAYQFHATAAEANSAVDYVLAKTKIMVSAAGLQLSYSLYAESDLGANVYVELILDDGTKLSSLVPSMAVARGQKGKWVDVKIDLPENLVGKVIEYVAVSYQGGAGDVNVYIDDIILQSTGSEKLMLQKAVKTAGTLNGGEALAAAVAAGQATLDSAASNKKAFLNAMKEIDNAIRELDEIKPGDPSDPSDPSDPTDPEGLLGDVDGDKKITSTDARLTLQFYAGKITEEDLDATVADVDGDSKITSTDARLILQKYAGKIEAFPAE